MNKTLVVKQIKWDITVEGVAHTKVANINPAQEATQKEIVELIVANSNKAAIDKDSVVITTADNKAYNLNFNEINNNEGDVNMNTTVNNTLNNEELVEKESHFKFFENLIDETAEMMANTKQMDVLKNLINADEDVVYDELLNALDKIVIRNKVSASVASKLMDKQEEIEEAVQNLEAETPAEKKSELWARIKSIVKVAVRKIVAFLEGTAWFAIDTTAILGTAAMRIATTTGKELFHATKAIGKAFKKDIFDTVKNA
jgi:hypothetical protein